MTHRSLAVLIVLNAALLLGLGGVVLSPQRAQAQFGAKANYTMISGDVKGRSGQAAIYVVDLTSSRVAPFFYNADRKKFEHFSGRVIIDDIKRLGESR